jgi:hypothetical protein
MTTHNLKSVANHNIKRAESFVLFTFTESSGYQLTHQIFRANDFNGLVDFMKHFIAYHEDKNRENTKEFLNQKYGDFENDEKAEYLG